VPVVLDPVMVAKSGDSLLADDAVAALVADLLPLATVVTPNLPEARRLAGRGADGPGDEAEQESLARDIGAGGVAVLVKGGHAAAAEVVDVLFADGAVIASAARGWPAARRTVPAARCPRHWRCGWPPASRCRAPSRGRSPTCARRSRTPPASAPATARSTTASARRRCRRRRRGGPAARQ
jgi:hypothetical protein